MRIEVVVLKPPTHWNIGTLDDAAPAIEAPVLTRVEILTGDDAYWRTGKKEPCVSIRRGKDLVGYLRREDLQRLLALMADAEREERQ